MLAFLGKYSIITNGILLVALLSFGFYVKSIKAESKVLEEKYSVLEQSVKVQNIIIQEQEQKYNVTVKILDDKDVAIKKLQEDRKTIVRRIDQVKVDDKIKTCLESIIPKEFVDILNNTPVNGQ